MISIDSGMFQCLASNPAGNIQSSAFLNVFHAGNLTVCSKLNNVIILNEMKDLV